MISQSVLIRKCSVFGPELEYSEKLIL
uniref:Uncharacterized protein n=1 Tax=Anguilla anguilla TaxID=7936 RepID=A0A0E9UNC7_ANGAN